MNIGFDRTKPVETKYEEIADEFLRTDLFNLAQKLKKEVIDNPIRLKMPIQEFEKKWLTYFICKVEKGVNNNNNIPITNWIIEVTGNPYTWVDIVKPNGEIAYSVPPIINSKAVNIQPTDFYHHIMEITSMVESSRPKAEIEAYRQSKILNMISRDENADTFIAEINKIAMYYGYKPFTEQLPDGDKFTEEVKNQHDGFSNEVVREDEF